MLLYELQVEENMVTVSDDATDEVVDEGLSDPFASDNSMNSELLEKLFEKEEFSMRTGKTKPNPQDKTKHRETVSSYPEPSVFICDICDAKLLTKSTLKAHMLRHIPQPNAITCDICPQKKTFANNLGLRRHKMYYHSNDPKKYVRTCDQCNRSFKNQNLLNCHKRYDHTIKRQLTCQKCGKVFKNKITLGNHVKKLHSTEVVQFECDLCSKRFSRKIALLEHQSVHTGERKYKCLWCPKSFRNSSHFSTHRSTVHNKEYLKWKREQYK